MHGSPPPPPSFGSDLRFNTKIAETPLKIVIRYFMNPNEVTETNAKKNFRFFSFITICILSSEPDSETLNFLIHQKKIMRYQKKKVSGV